jgi:hypothetical protein
VTEPNSDNAADLQLLLCDAGDNRPLLGAGLSESALAAAKSPERGPRGQDSMHLEALHSDPNDLHAQRWAVIAPKGAEGDAALAAIAALIEHRGAQQGAAPIIYRVPDAMDAVDSLRWKNDVLRDEDVPVDERPRYLLILGDLHQVSLELQHVLANGSFVGRLHCPTIKGYRAYAEKVIARERATPTPKPRALYYTVQDGSAAIGVGHRHLIEPCMRMTADLVERGKLDAQRPSEIPYSEWGPDEMLAMAGIDAPSLLCSVSHGLGAPRKGWRSPDHQRQMQGALALGPDGPLTADMLRETPFLPGGIWMCVACYGAGTPAASAYHAWLALLAEQGGNREQVDAVLRALPAAGDRPFVAALPQALLANPGGPLAVIGHMDLAWTFGFCDPESKRSRASRMLATQRAILAGGRVGVGLDALMHAYRETNDDLMARYQLQRDALARNQADPVAPRLLGELWMQRNDLRGYVLLGDPAARLAVVGGQPAALAENPDLDARRPPAITVRSPASAPAAASPAQQSPPVQSPPVQSPPIESPRVESPPVESPRIESPPVQSPPIESPRIESPPVESPRVESPPIESPRVKSPPVESPRVQPPAVPEVAMTTPAPPPQPHPLAPTGPAQPIAAAPETYPQAAAPGHYPPSPPLGAAPLGAVTRPRTLENPEIGLRERAVLALLRGDEAPRSIAVRFGLPIEEVFYWLDVYREAGRRSLGG